MYKELRKNKNKLQITVIKKKKKSKQFKHVVARTCAPSEHTSCGSRSGTVPCVNQRQLCCKSFCHKSTSTMVDESDVAESGGQVVPPARSTGGRSHTLSKNLPPPLDGTQLPGTDGRV